MKLIYSLVHKEEGEKPLIVAGSFVAEELIVLAEQMEDEAGEAESFYVEVSRAPQLKPQDFDTPFPSHQ